MKWVDYGDLPWPSVLSKALFNIFGLGTGVVWVCHNYIHSYVIAVKGMRKRSRSLYYIEWVGLQAQEV